MTKYVLGFCFNPGLTKVVLIKKTRPEWQAGRLNGLGGHVEENETPPQAMEREFRDEAAWTEPLDWRQFGRLSRTDWEVHLFYSVCKVAPGPQNDSDEGEVREHHVDVVLNHDTSQGIPVLPNLRYLIPMALNHLRGVDKARFFDIREDP